MNAPASPHPKSRRRLVVGITAIAILTALALGVAVGFEPWLRGRIQSEARARGVELEFLDYDLSWQRLVLQGVSFRQSRPLVSSGTIERVVIEHEWLRPRSIAIESATIDVVATGTQLLDQLTAQKAPSAQAAQVPVRASDLRLRWQLVSNGPVVLELNGASCELDANAARWSGPFLLLGRLPGNGRLDWQKAERRANADISFTGLPRLTAVLRADKDPLLLEVTVAKTLIGPALALLLGRMDVAMTTLSGKLELAWPTRLSMSEPGGKAYLTLGNFEPPHPAELQGFDFGTQTDVATDFEVGRGYRKLTLSNTRVQAGSFALNGGGLIDTKGAELKLKGALGCVPLAKAAAEARLGSVLGHWAGKLAQRHLEGNVAFEIDVGVSFAAPPVPHLKKRIIPGCGLKPLSVTDLPNLQRLGLDLAELEAQLRGTLPELPPLLKQAPSLLPGFPAFPTLPDLLQAPPAGDPSQELTQPTPLAPSGTAAPSGSAAPGAP